MDEYHIGTPDHELQTPEEAGEPDYAELHRRESEIMRELRKEAFDVKDCFARYSFQALAASSGLLLFLARFHFDTQAAYMGLFACLPVLLLIAVLSMGIHKYGTANRLLGYELHLQRMHHYVAMGALHPTMLFVGWEEAMRAWRIVQSTVFSAIYTPWFSGGSPWITWLTWRLIPIVYRKDVSREIDRLAEIAQKQVDEKNEAIETPEQSTWYGIWFSPRLSIERMPRLRQTANNDEAATVELRAYYRSGGYIKSQVLLFYTLIAICIAFAIYTLWAAAFPVWPTVLFSLLVVLLALRTINLATRIRILEDGVHSIHACAILWEATVLAHFIALNSRFPSSPRTDANVSIHGYTVMLGREAAKIAKETMRLHHWIEATRPHVVETLRRNTTIMRQRRTSNQVSQPQAMAQDGNGSEPDGLRSH